MNIINTRTLYIPEVLKNASEIKDISKRVQYLQKNGSPALQQILQYAYNPLYVSKLSDDDIEDVLKADYKPPYGALGHTETHLFMEYKRLYLFFTNSTVNLDVKELKSRLVQLREVLHAEEFDVLIAMLKKAPLARGVNKAVVKQAFPKLL